MDNAAYTSTLQTNWSMEGSSIDSLVVQGENVGQTFQFVYSQNAEFGLVALSQVLRPQEP